jgi:hypothetical protein
VGLGWMRAIVGGLQGICWGAISWVACKEEEMVGVAEDKELDSLAIASRTGSC